MASMAEKLEIIKKILTKSTDFICDNLNPEDLLRTLKSEGAISENDGAYIRAKVTSADQAELLISILKRKPVESYEIFKETLKTKGRGDIYAHLKNKELEEGYVVGESVQNHISRIYKWDKIIGLTVFEDIPIFKPHYNCDRMW